LKRSEPRAHLRMKMKKTSPPAVRALSSGGFSIGETPNWSEGGVRLFFAHKKTVGGNDHKREDDKSTSSAEGGNGGNACKLGKRPTVQVKIAQHHFWTVIGERRLCWFRGGKGATRKKDKLSGRATFSSGSIRKYNKKRGRGKLTTRQVQNDKR